MDQIMTSEEKERFGFVSPEVSKPKLAPQTIPITRNTEFFVPKKRKIILPALKKP